MRRPRLLEALERTLGDSFSHHLPPAQGQVATAKPLATQGIYHLCHFGHQDCANLADDVPTEINCIASGDVAGKESANEPRISLLKELGGKSGESLKNGAASEAYHSPPAGGAVANGGKSGENQEPGPALLAHLHQALLPAPSPPVSDVARRHGRINRWLSQHPPPSCPPNQCAHCGEPIHERAKDAVPVLRSLRPPEPIWLHLTCSYAWYDKRLAAAAAAVLDGPAADGVAR